MTRILITGGAGLVGSYLARRLLRAGDDVALYDLEFNSPIIASLGAGEFRRIHGDIRDGEQIAKAIAEHAAEVVVHLAAVLGARCNDDPVLCAEANCVGSTVVLEQSLRASVGRVVLASSVAVYGPDDLYPAGDIEEDAPRYLSETYQLYGAGKVFLESAAALYARKGLSTCGLRLSMALGPGRRLDSASYGIASVIDRVALTGRGRISYSAGDAICYVYVEDVASQLEALCRAPESSIERYRFFNSGGDVITLSGFARTLAETVPGAVVETTELPERQLHRATLRVSDRRLRESVGVARAYSVAGGLAAHVEEARKLHELGFLRIP